SPLTLQCKNNRCDIALPNQSLQACLCLINHGLTNLMQGFFDLGLLEYTLMDCFSRAVQRLCGETDVTLTHPKGFDNLVCGELIFSSHFLQVSRTIRCFVVGFASR